MAENTDISWAHHTFNPWIGCTIKSAGCANCYAMSFLDTRLHKVQWGPSGERVLTSPGNWKAPLRWNAECFRTGTRARVFCASLADVFDDHPSIQPAWRAALWALIDATPHLDWLLLTKRPENWLHMLPVAQPGQWLSNVRLGVSIEDQAAADERGVLLQLIADLDWPTFVSYGPAIGPVDWAPFIAGRAIGWMVAEGESGGPKSRPTNPDWFRAGRDVCVPAGVPFHLKQWGSHLPCDWDGEDEKGGIAYNIDEEHSEIDYDVLGNGFRVVAHGREYVRFPHKNTGRTLDGVIWNQFPGDTVAGLLS